MLGLATLAGGCHLGGGPVVGYGLGRGLVLGWEAGGGPLSANVNVGQSWRPGPDLSHPARLDAQPEPAVPVAPDDESDAAGDEDEGAGDGADSTVAAADELVSYLVFEPWFFVGGTIGVAWEWDAPGTRLAAGVWEASPVATREVNRDPEDWSAGDLEGFTIAIGYRYLAGAHELYLAPKFIYLWQAHALDG